MNSAIAMFTSVDPVAAATLAQAAERISILAAESARLCNEILAGMTEREREMRAIWNPPAEGAGDR